MPCWKRAGVDRDSEATQSTVRPAIHELSDVTVASESMFVQTEQIVDQPDSESHDKLLDLEECDQEAQSHTESPPSKLFSGNHAPI